MALLLWHVMKCNTNDNKHAYGMLLPWWAAAVGACWGPITTPRGTEYPMLTTLCWTHLLQSAAAGNACAYAYGYLKSRMSATECVASC